MSISWDTAAPSHWETKHTSRRGPTAKAARSELTRIPHLHRLARTAQLPRQRQKLLLGNSQRPSFSQKLTGPPDEYKTCRYADIPPTQVQPPGHLGQKHPPPRHPKNLGIILASVLIGKPKGRYSHSLLARSSQSPSLPSSGGHHEGCISRQAM